MLIIHEQLQNGAAEAARQGLFWFSAALNRRPLPGCRQGAGSSRNITVLLKPEFELFELVLEFLTGVKAGQNILPFTGLFSIQDIFPQAIMRQFVAIQHHLAKMLFLKGHIRFTPSGVAKRRQGAIFFEAGVPNNLTCGGRDLNRAKRPV